MINLLGILSLAALQAAGGQGDKPDLGKPELKWKVNLDSHFTFKFSFLEERREQSTNKGIGNDNATFERSSALLDKREVDAELAFHEVPGRPWALSIDLKKVTWTYGTELAEVTLTMTEGKEPVVKSTLKARNKGDLERATQDAERRSDLLRKGITGQYDITAEANGQVIVIRGGGYDQTYNLFTKCYVQSQGPADAVSQGQTWKDMMPGTTPALQEIGVNEFPLKVLAVNDKGIKVSGSLTIPLTPPAAPDVKASGNFSFEREFLFAREGFIQTAKEEIAYRRSSSSSSKLGAGGKQSASEETTHNLKQSIKIAAKVAKPAEPKK